jgi:hypothetical protein
MKVLLDENLPVKLKRAFSSAIQVYTIYDMKWNSLKNGELLKSIGENGFDALITSDKSIIHQHNLSKFNFRFIIIKASDNQYQTILPLISVIEETLLLSKEKVVHISGLST